MSVGCVFGDTSKAERYPASPSSRPRGLKKQANVAATLSEFEEDSLTARLRFSAVAVRYYCIGAKPDADAMLFIPL